MSLRVGRHCGEAPLTKESDGTVAGQVRPERRGARKLCSLGRLSSPLVGSCFDEECEGREPSEITQPEVKVKQGQATIAGTVRQG